MSEESARLIDAEIRSYVDRAYALALEGIRHNREFLLAGAERLLAVETLDDVAINELWGRLGGGARRPRATRGRRSLRRSLARRRGSTEGVTSDEAYDSVAEQPEAKAAAT